MADLSKPAIVISIIAIIISIVAISYSAAMLGNLNSRVSTLSKEISGLRSAIQHIKTVTPSTVTVVKTKTTTAVKTTTATAVKTKTVTSVTTATKTTVKTTTAVKTSAAPVTLTIYAPWAGDEKKWFMAVVKAFEKEHPNVKVQYVTMRAEDLAKAMPIQFAAGISPADVIFTPWAWWIIKMAQKGYVEPLNGIINPNEYIQGIIYKVEWNGKLWAAPFTMWLKPGFWYRKSFFKAHHLWVPKNWSSFLKLLQTIKKIPGIVNPIVSGDSKGWPLSDIVEHFLITFGGPKLQIELISGKVKFNSTIVKHILGTYLVPLIEKGYFSKPIDWTTAITLWWHEKYALYFMGTWITGMVPNASDLGFFTLPGCKGVVGGADYAFVPKFAKHLKLALEFVKFAATEGQVIHSSEPSGKVPTWLKAPTSKIWGPMRQIYETILKRHMKILPDLDDSVGGSWQLLFWDQLKLLWVEPHKLDQVLNTLAAHFPYKRMASFKYPGMSG